MWHFHNGILLSPDITDIPKGHYDENRAATVEILQDATYRKLSRMAEFTEAKNREHKA